MHEPVTWRDWWAMAASVAVTLVGLCAAVLVVMFAGRLERRSPVLFVVCALLGVVISGGVIKCVAGLREYFDRRSAHGREFSIWGTVLGIAGLVIGFGVLWMRSGS
jgi:predicted permease